MRKNEKNYLTIITDGGNIGKLSEMSSEPFSEQKEAGNHGSEREKLLKKF